MIVFRAAAAAAAAGTAAGTATAVVTVMSADTLRSPHVPAGAARLYDADCF
jgi:hypothetical protein